MTALFIRRPVMTVLVMLGILFFGASSYRRLPVNDLPAVDFPTISVNANLSGASPETMASSVATPLEKQFSTIAGIDNMTSTSTLGSTSITIQFSLDRDIDAAAADVQAAISRVLRSLPFGILPPSYRKVNPADAPILYYALTSSTLPLSQLDEYGETFMAQRISMVPGIAQVQVYGGQQYAVRIQLDPTSLANRGIGIDEVASAISAQNVSMPTGTLWGTNRASTIVANGQLRNAGEFKRMVVAYRNGAPVHLQELGDVTDDVENNKVASWYNDDRAVVLAIQRQPGTNTVAVAQGVKTLVERLRSEIPASVEIETLYDRSVPIEESVRDVKLTLMLTLFLVVMVIFIFLRNVSATVIPSLALPMSLVGTFAVMYLFGYSLDNLSLMALTLAVGFVVDDAIVMLENIVRHMEMGKSPMQAAFDGSAEVGFTILAMTASLTAVFIPLLFMGGIIGRLFHEFAVTIGTAILVSGFVSVTLTPMLSSRFLRPTSHQHGRLFNATERIYARVLGRYESSLGWVMQHRFGTLMFSLAVLVGTVVLFKVVPTGFIPTADTGQISVTTEAAQGTSFPEMIKLQQQAAAILAKDPNIAGFMSSVGSGFGGSGNQGRFMLALKPHGERAKANDIVAELRPKLSGIPGMNVYMQIPPAIQIGGRSSKSQYQFTLQSPDIAALDSGAARMEARMRGIPQIQDVTSDLQIANPQVIVQIDRDRAASLGVTAEQIDDLHADQSVHGDHGAPPPVSAGHCGARNALYPLPKGGTGSPQRGREHERGHWSAGDYSLRPAASGDHLVQYSTGCRSLAGDRRGRGRRGYDAAFEGYHRLLRNGAGLSGEPAGTARAPGARDLRHLHGARHPLRELHSPRDDSHRPSLRGVRRAAGALGVPDGARRVWIRRADPTHRNREEERNHDDRLCSRGGAP